EPATRSSSATTSEPPAGTSRPRRSRSSTPRARPRPPILTGISESRSPSATRRPARRRSSFVAHSPLVRSPPHRRVVMHSLKRSWLLIGALAALIGVSFADDVPSLTKEREIALPGEGSWDYVTVDSAAERLYVAHATRIDVVDLKKNEKVGEVAGVE